MRFWHIVLNQENEVEDQLLLSTEKKQLSLECLEEIIGGKYEIHPSSY